jgi:hypothetical protein|tara:strand:- start:404 stop:1606 length:1203 start_codon:yes stop_codon:yes gene_type:complete
MGLFSGIKRAVKKVTGSVKKVVSKVAKGVKKAVKGVAKVVKKVGKGVKKLAKNKYVQMGLMIAAAVTLPMFVPAIANLGVVAAGAVTGAITGAGGALLQGGDFKDVLKGAAFGSATGAAFAKIGEAIKTAQASTAKATGAFDASKPIDVAALPKDASGAIDLNSLGTTSVSPQGALSFSETTGLYTDSLGRSFTSDLSGNFTSVGPTLDMGKIGSLDVSKNIGTSFTKPLGAVSYSETTNLYTDSIGRSFTSDEVMLGKNISMGEQVATTKIDVTDSSFRQAAGLPDITGREPTFGDKLKDKLKDAFSPEKLTDAAVGMAEDAVVGGLRNLAGGNETEQINQGGRQFQAGLVDPIMLQQVQYAHSQASVDFNTSHQNLLYGTADMSHYTPLETQETIKVS